MANEIKELFGTPTAFTITVASLATSTAGVGRQSTMVDNSTTRAGRVFVFVKIKLGTSPSNNKAVYIYGIRGDGTNRDDAAGASDAALTVLNCPLIGVLSGKASAATGDVLQGWFVFENPGKEFGIAIVHDTAVNLDSTGGNHSLQYMLDNPEVQ